MKSLEEVRDPHTAETAEKETKPLPAMEKAAAAYATGGTSSCNSAHTSWAVAV